MDVLRASTPHDETQMSGAASAGVGIGVLMPCQGDALLGSSTSSIGEVCVSEQNRLKGEVRRSQRKPQLESVSADFRPPSNILHPFTPQTHLAPCCTLPLSSQASQHA